MCKLEFEGFLTTESLENALAEHLRRDRPYEQVIIDLKKVQWLRPFSLSTLFVLSKYELRKERTVQIHMPMGGFAQRYMETTGAIQAFETHSVQVNKPIRSSLRLQQLSLFRSLDKGEGQAFIQQLENTAQQQRLLHTPSVPEFVQSGTFHRVVLRELLDNAFIHGRDANVHAVAFQAGDAEGGVRGDHPLFPGFAGAPYLEVVVGDTCDHDLVRTLSSTLPANYSPKVRAADHSKLTKDERTIVYAFEYGSTSDPEGRIERVRQYLETRKGQCERLATGLYMLRSIAATYRGQILFRTGGHLGTLDFSNAAEHRDKPRVFFWRGLNSRRPAKLPGTIIGLRIPLAGRGVDTIAVGTRHRMKEPKRIHTAIKLLPVESLNEERNQKGLLDSLDAHLADMFAEAADHPCNVVVILATAHVPENAKAACIELLSQPTRYRSGLMILVSSHEELEIIEKNWKNTLDQGTNDVGFQRFPSLVVATLEGRAVTVYGSPDIAGATSTKENVICLPNGIEENLVGFIHKAITQHIASIVESPRCKYEGGLYLIENKYYTRVFFEVGKLFSLSSDRKIFLQWLLSQLLRFCPGVLLVRARKLEDEVTEFIKQVFPEGNAPSVIRVSQREPTIALALEATRLAGDDKRIMILVDVICMARFIKKILPKFPNPELVVVVCIVDARVNEPEYLPVLLPNNPIKVEVISILRHPIHALQSFPQGEDPNDILIIDKETHAPTKYPVPLPPSLDEKALLEKITKNYGVSFGHYELNEKHYTYFFTLPNIIRSPSIGVQDWIQQELHHLRTAIGSDWENVTILCLDGDSGLVEIVEAVVGRLELPLPQIISYADLQAPPAERIKRPGTLWFLLPILATEENALRALDYAALFQAAHVRVSVVVERLKPMLSRMLQKLDSYGKCKVQYNAMVSLPLTETEGECPVCSFIREIESAYRALGSTEPILKGIARAWIERLTLVPVQPAGETAVRSTKASPQLWREIYMRVLFERADRDAGVRRRLDDELQESVDACIALATTAGLAPNYGAFSSTSVERILYDKRTRGKLSEACNLWVKGITGARVSDPLTLLRQLRGFSRLAGEALRVQVHTLFQAASRDRDLAQTLILVALLDPSLFWEGVDQVTNLDDENLLNALIELRQFLRQGGGGDEMKGILAFHNIRWWFGRSSPWWISLGVLRMEALLTRTTRESLEEAYGNFIRKGLAKARQFVQEARTLAPMWTELSEELALDKTWIEIETAVQQLGGEIDAFQGDSSPLLKACQQLKTVCETFVSQMDGIAINPRNEMDILQQECKEHLNTEWKIVFDVEVDCPAIAIDRGDFRDVVLSILENTSEKDKHARGATTTFRFFQEGGANDFVNMEVSQDRPFEATTGMLGGLETARKFLARYGAIPRFSNASPGEPYIRVRFLVWPIP